MVDKKSKERPADTDEAVNVLPDEEKCDVNKGPFNFVSETMMQYVKDDLADAEKEHNDWLKELTDAEKALNDMAQKDFANGAGVDKLTPEQQAIAERF